jgi:exosortase
MPQDIVTNSLRIRAVVLVGRPDFGRCSLAASLPTALWPVWNKTALELLLDHLSREGVGQIVVCCSREISPRVEPVCQRFGSGVRVLKEDLATGTAGCLRDAMNADSGDLVIVFSGSMVSAPPIRDLIDAHRASGATMTMVFNPGCSDEKTPNRPAEIYLCEPEVLSYIPRGGYSDIKEGLIPAILMGGGTIRPTTLHEDVGNFHDRDSYLNALLGHLARQEKLSIVELGDQGDGCGAVTVSDVSIHPTARIYGPVAIADHARVCDHALVVGPAVIGRESVVGRGSAVVRSVLWDRVSVGSQCELRESVVDRLVAVPDGAAFAECAVTAERVRQCRKSKTAGPLPGGESRLDAIWRGRMRKPVLAVFIGTVVAAFLWSYWPSVLELWDLWNKSDEYSAGMLVPLLALYVVWIRRQSLGSERIRPAVLPGIIAFTLAQALRSIGLYFMYGSGERLSIVLSIGAIILLWCGWAVLRKTAVILLFLCLMLPWPNSIQSRVGLPLQTWATASAVFCLELTGHDVLRDGNVIHIGNASVAVAEACNGLRMVMAFFVISGLVALLVQRAWWEKLLVFASSVPIAMFCNTLRLTATAVAFTVLKGDYWTKMFHDFGGYAMMPLALALVVGELWVLAHLTAVPNDAKPLVVVRRRP